MVVFQEQKIPSTEEPGRLQVHGAAKSWIQLSTYTRALLVCRLPGQALRLLFMNACLAEFLTQVVLKQVEEGMTIPE